MARKRKRNKESQFYSTNQNDDDDDNDEKKENITTVKVPLKKVLRPEFRAVITAAIKEKALESTKICHLASLLLLQKAQLAFDSRDIDFFQKLGFDVIKDRFDAVLQQNVHTPKMNEDFRDFVEYLDEDNRFDWPNNNYFGNALKDLVDQYCSNVKTNLNTHKKKRLREYLRMIVYQHRDQFEEGDINHTISWAIYGNESIRGNTLECVQRRQRRNDLLQIIQSNSWFEIEHTHIGRFTKQPWFASIQMWIAMQREIDAFNTTRDQRIDRIEQRRQLRQEQWGKKPKNKPKPEKKVIKPPKVRNLAVIPICDIQRMHNPIDNYTFYKLLCGTDLIPKYKSERKVKGKYEKNVPFNDFMDSNQYYWNQIFYMRKINYFVRYKNNFRFRILSDGITVSLQYEVPEKDFNPLYKEQIVQKYENGEIHGEAAIDLGDRTWMAYVYRDVATQKEVCRTMKLLLLCIPFVCTT